MLADYSGIHSEVCYYVPLNQTYEVWHLKVTNASACERNLTITGYAEFTNNNNYEQDQVNLQYSQFITSTVFETNRIRHIIHGNLDWVKEGEEVDNKLAISRFFALTGAPVDSYCGDKESFLGRYHGYHNPVGGGKRKIIRGNVLQRKRVRSTGSSDASETGRNKGNCISCRNERT